MFKRILPVVVLALTLATVVGTASPDVPEPGCGPCQSVIGTASPDVPEPGCGPCQG